MSPAERSVRHRKLRTDRAISEAYSRLAADARARATFSELLEHVRRRAPRLLDVPDVHGQTPAVEALVNLARFRTAHVRTMASWSGSAASWRAAVDSLAQHLLAKYPIPAFLAAAWYAIDDDYAEAKRQWFVAHARGASFRSLGLPIQLTRRMEHFFLRSHDHYEIEYALRRAELLGLGADDRLAGAVLGTRLALDLSHGGFWRTVWLFLIANARAIDIAQVGPIIDFLDAIQHERVAVETAAGIVLRKPVQPEFSLKGRTARSVVRLMEQWHRDLGLVRGGLSWEPSRLRPLVVDVPQDDPSRPPARWELTELTNSEQLRAEGAALRHCVASYSHGCWRGASRIWSVRRRAPSGVRPVVTVEVDPKSRSIVQARGFRNRRASGRALQIVQAWAARERLRLAI